MRPVAELRKRWTTVVDRKSHCINVGPRKSLTKSELNQPLERSSQLVEEVVRVLLQLFLVLEFGFADATNLHTDFNKKNVCSVSDTWRGLERLEQTHRFPTL